MKFSRLKDSKQIIFVSFLGERIAVEYDVRGYSDPVYVAFAQANKLPEDNPERQRINATVIKHMVTAWDLTEGCTDECEAHKANGHGPICREHATPVTDETIAELPQLLRNVLAGRVMLDVTGEGDDPKRNSSS